MKIKKRDGSLQNFMPNKLLTRIKSQSKGLKIDAVQLFQDVVPHISDGMSSTEIDELLAFKAADKTLLHPDYSMLGGRILITRQGKLIGKELEPVDYTYNFFAATTFLKKYSEKIGEHPIELPSCMYKRAASALAITDNEYDLFLSELQSKRMNFATPIYTNVGIKNRNGNISCNLTHLAGDSIEDIEETLTKMAFASKEGAGIGLLIDPLRSKESNVSTFNGKAGGVVRLADMVQSKMRFYKQGSRSGSCALYLSVWHKDIFDFLSLTLPVGDEQMRTRDLFTSVVINDLFMEKLKTNEDWYLFCPNDIMKAGLKPLHMIWGAEFETEYHKAVELGLGKAVKPKDILDSIIISQVESGKPYVMYKDNANRRNMQNNIGVVTQSNLCIEIFEVSKPKYTAQCTLGSINLAEHDTIETIIHSTKVMVRALNRVIDVNKWSDDWSKEAGLDQRALAIGVAGMADFFAKKKISFESQEAKDWNAKISEEMYKAAVEESMFMAMEEQRNYPAWEGSPYSNGETYIEGWSPLPEGKPIPLLNSLFLANMPTASCHVKELEIKTLQGVKSYKEILEENNIDWKTIESTNNQQWIQLDNPITVFNKDLVEIETSAIFYNGHVETLKIEMEDGTFFECSYNHKFLVTRDGKECWVEAIDLLENDDIVNINEAILKMKIIKITKNGVKPTWDIDVPTHHHYITKNGCVSHNSAILLSVFESFEPATSNLFIRTVGQGEFLVINKYLVAELEDLGIWDDEMRNDFIVSNGSVQDIYRIPDDLKYRYKDVWEIPQKTLLDLAIIRNKYIDQSQSLNIYHASADFKKISSALMYAWKKGLKTGVYYTRTKDKREKNHKLATNLSENVPNKPKDSPFECFGCSA